MLKVCSYMRSGTHFLMASLAANFQFDGDLSLEAHADGRLWCDKKRTKLNVPWGKLFGSHKRFEEIDIPADEILYLMRNPLDVMRSNWEFQGKKGTINEYAHDSRILCWMEHVQEYCKHCRYVKYEDLFIMPAATLHSIQQEFKLKRIKKRYQIITERVGWLPHKRMTPREGYRLSTINRFRQILGNTFMGYKI